MARVVQDLELIKIVARIRKLYADGYKIVEISKLTGWSRERIWYVKEGINYPKLSLPINELDLRKPANESSLCRRCGNRARIFAKSNLCIECELFELSKLGLVVISDPNKPIKDDERD